MQSNVLLKEERREEERGGWREGFTLDTDIYLRISCNGGLSKYSDEYLGS
jgi:hypothetical protein